MPSYTILFMYIIVKKLLVSGGGQLIGNDDSVKIAGVWVTIVTSDFNVFIRYGFF